MHQRVAIVGCGAIGVTTALAIQEKIPNSEITIFTKEVSPYTTSDVAAGLWEPVFLKDTPEEKILQWSTQTYNQLLKWWREGKAKKYGICLQPAILCTDEIDFKFPKWLETTLAYQKLPENVLDKMSERCGFKLTAGLYFITFTWEASIFLKPLQKEFKENGGKIIIKQIKDLKELESFDAIVNCTGLGARDLIVDPKVEPIRGQVKKIKAPWLFQTKIIDSDKMISYIIPTTYLCTLGGTANYNNYDTTVDKKDKEDIERNCAKVQPSIASAKVVRDVVGLRPGRAEVRVESEVVKFDNKEVRVVHNYGHGGAGITLCLGCAEEAANLLQRGFIKNKL